MSDPFIVATKCKWEYESGEPNTYTFVCTILIVLFTILLEFAVHSYINCCSSTDNDFQQRRFSTPTQTPLHSGPTHAVVNEQPKSQPSPTFTTARTYTTTEPAKNIAFSNCCCVASAPPNIRANRLLAAVLLYAVVLTAFIIRIHDIADPYIRPECVPYTGKGNVSPPAWGVVVLLNIVPFILATFSVTRAVVDCWLVRSGRGLKSLGGGDWTMWPPCMPFYLLFVGVRTVLMLPIALLMGRPLGSVGGKYDAVATIVEDVEMQGEEMRRLIDEHARQESDYEGSFDGPPTYEAAVNDESGARK